MIKQISSSDNDEIKFLKKIISRSSFRHSEKLFVAEGLRQVFDIDRSLIKRLYLSSSFYNKHKDTLKGSYDKLRIVSDNIFNKITPTENSQGIMALVKMKGVSLVEYLKDSNFLLVLDHISDPGNMGTIIRTAEAAGVELILCVGCVDIYNPKVVRSTMGAITRQNIVTLDNEVEVIKLLKDNGIRMISSTLEAKNNYRNFNYPKKLALIMGSEAHGISETFIKESDITIKIDMSGKIDSLNVGVATGILLYEIRNAINIDF